MWWVGGWGGLLADVLLALPHATSLLALVSTSLLAGWKSRTERTAYSTFSPENPEIWGNEAI